MLIKSADGRDKDIQILEALAARPDVTPSVKRKIEKEIQAIKAGVWGESQAAYAINFDYEKSENLAIIHDLRIEHDGRVAQIDHILVDRLFEVTVIESKNFGGGMAVDANGDFVVFYDKRPFAIPSPVEQNRRHCAVLDALFRSKEFNLPTRLGGFIVPKISSVVMLSNTSRITIDKSLKAADFNIIKADRLGDWGNKQTDKIGFFGAVGGMARIVSSKTVREFAEQLAALHKPIQFDWEARFGLAPKDHGMSDDAAGASQAEDADGQDVPQVTVSP